jgi:hypothetical protein
MNLNFLKRVGIQYSNPFFHMEYRNYFVPNLKIKQFKMALISQSPFIISGIPYILFPKPIVSNS